MMDFSVRENCGEDVESMIIIKDEDALVRMRESAQIAAKVRDAVAKKVGPGVTTGELGDYAHELIGKAGGKSAFLGYKGYPGEIIWFL